jgi:hypothetical protein
LAALDLTLGIESKSIKEPSLREEISPYVGTEEKNMLSFRDRFLSFVKFRGGLDGSL